MNKPADRTYKPREWVTLTNYGFVDQDPRNIETLDFTEHMVAFAGAEKRSGFAWALHGTTAINTGLFHADTYASAHRKYMLTLQLWYYLPNFELLRKLTRENAEIVGCLHMDRAQLEYREELKDEVIARFKDTTSMTIAKMRKLQQLTLNELVLELPEAVPVLFDLNPALNLIVHPVRQLVDKKDKVPVNVGTFRLLPEHVMATEVRYHEHIKLTW